MNADIYNVLGKKAGSIDLPTSVFGIAWNDSLMHQVVTSMQGNARAPLAHTKTRGDVRGGGKKPWQQKGTGRARHGSIRSPIWKGGGVTHGPRNDTVFARSIPKKMRAKALFMALSKKLADGQIIFVDSFGTDSPKTAAAKKALVAIGKAASIPALSTKRKNAALIALSDPRESSLKSFRNIGSVSCEAVRNLNPVEVLRYSYILVEDPNAAVAILSHRASKKPVAGVAVKTARRGKKEANGEKAEKLLQKGDQ